jgi:hypothetical protein
MELVSETSVANDEVPSIIHHPAHTRKNTSLIAIFLSNTFEKITGAEALRRKHPRPGSVRERRSPNSDMDRSTTVVCSAWRPERGLIERARAPVGPGKEATKPGPQPIV